MAVNLLGKFGQLIGFGQPASSDAEAQAIFDAGGTSQASSDQLTDTLPGHINSDSGNMAGGNRLGQASGTRGNRGAYSLHTAEGRALAAESDAIDAQEAERVAAENAEIKAGRKATNAARPGPNPFAAPTSRLPIVGAFDYQAQARARQQALIDQLHGIATGKIKSPAMEQFEQQVVQAQNQSMSNASSLRDVGPGGQRQIAAQNAAAIQGQGIQNSAILQTQQQAVAEQQLVRLYEQQRAGDLSVAESQARGVIGNRGLDDALNTRNFNRLYNFQEAAALRQQDFARAVLGFDTGQQAQTRSTTMATGELVGTGFDYLRRARGDEPDAVDNTTRPSRGYDIRNEGDK